jgi:hypothetical protein
MQTPHPETPSSPAPHQRFLIFSEKRNRTAYVAGIANSLWFRRAAPSTAKICSVKLPSYSFCVVSAALGCLFSALTARAVPPAGLYRGTVRITKEVAGEPSLTTAASIRVVASVKEVGPKISITIVSSVPQNLVEAFTEDLNVLRGEFNPDGSLTLVGPFRPPADTLRGDQTAYLIAPFARWDAASTADQYHAAVVEGRNGFTLKHGNTPIGVTYNYAPPQVVTFEYTLRRASK